jgi:hypothetical protein
MLAWIGLWMLSDEHVQRHAAYTDRVLIVTR